MKNIPVLIFLLTIVSFSAKSQTEIWSKLELNFSSDQVYENPLYDVGHFYAVFTSPTGREKKVNGFWDGERNFKIRFSPDEPGKWTYRTSCSNQENKGLHQQEGKFNSVSSSSKFPIFKKGAIKRSKGEFHLTYGDGTPFFFTACTAWNGALKSTEDEWEEYLTHRAKNNYNVIQFVTTQWKGSEKDQYGEVAFTGSGRISLNPEFFRRLDVKFDEINSHGLVAAPVLLWALPVGKNVEHSPGYFLPDAEAILLARYMVARYGAHQVIWILGGDGHFTDQYEQRWKTIGRAVFTEEQSGIVAQHPRRAQWVGEIYKDEDWLDIVGYQSGHSKEQNSVDWINKGPATSSWDKLPPRPLINLEPNYEELDFKISAADVRNASYWSIFSTPLAGITYGANGIWSWVQNESPTESRSPTPWYKSIMFPGSMQIGYLSHFIQQFEWWTLKPVPDLIFEQPGDAHFNHFISIVANDDRSTLLAYTPIQQEIRIRNSFNCDYEAKWFDPIKNSYQDALLECENGIIKAIPPSAQDYVLILER